MIPGIQGYHPSCPAILEEASKKSKRISTLYIHRCNFHPYYRLNREVLNNYKGFFVRKLNRNRIDCISQTNPPRQMPPVHCIISNLRASHSNSPGRQHRISNLRSVQARRDHLITSSPSYSMKITTIRQSSIRKTMKNDGKYLCFPNTQTITMITLTTKNLLMVNSDINNKCMRIRIQCRLLKTKVIIK